MFSRPPAAAGTGDSVCGEEPSSCNALSLLATPTGARSDFEEQTSQRLQSIETSLATLTGLVRDIQAHRPAVPSPAVGASREPAHGSPPSHVKSTSWLLLPSASAPKDGAGSVDASLGAAAQPPRKPSTPVCEVPTRPLQGGLRKQSVLGNINLGRRQMLRQKTGKVKLEAEGGKGSPGRARSALQALICALG